MIIEGDAIIHCGAECHARWLPTDDQRWQAHLGSDNLDAPGKPRRPAAEVGRCPCC
jgi:hypothetical protein